MATEINIFMPVLQELGPEVTVFGHVHCRSYGPPPRPWELLCYVCGEQIKHSFDPNVTLGEVYDKTIQLLLESLYKSDPSRLYRASTARGYCKIVIFDDAYCLLPIEKKQVNQFWEDM